MAGELSPALPKPSTVKDQSVIEAGKKDENTPEDFNMMDIDTQPELGVATTSTDNEQGTTMRGALPTPEDKGVGAAGSSAITPVPGVSGTAEPSEPTTFDEKVGWNKAPFPLFSYVLPMANSVFRRSVCI